LLRLYNRPFIKCTTVTWIQAIAAISLVPSGGVRAPLLWKADSKIALLLWSLQARPPCPQPAFALGQPEEVDVNDIWLRPPRQDL
jgi:hypothetical protein